MKKIEKEVELKIIELYNSGKSMNSIGLDIKISPVTVKNILERNKIPKRTKGGIYQLPSNEIVEAYKTRQSCMKLALKYNVTPNTIINILAKNNIIRNNNYHNLNLKENYWKIIDSFDKAYFLGFLLTDGNVCGNQIKLELGIKDINILEIFSKYTNNSNKIYISNRKEKGQFASFHVKRKTWINDL